MAKLSVLVFFIGAALQVGADRAGADSFIEVSHRGKFTRSAAALATDGGVGRTAAVQSTIATSGMARLHEALTVSSHMIPGEGGRAMMKCMAACVCFLILYKLLSSIDCYSKKLDCRRCRMCARFLMWAGWDEFEGFRISCTVHSVGDIANKGMMGGEKLFKVVVSFRWSKFMTSATGDMRWDQTKGIDVPQGADECVIALFSEGKIKDSKIGEYVLETKRDMLDAKKFWGEKKKLKLEEKGKLCGTILITFRNSEDEGEGGALPIEGIDEDCALAIAIREAHEEMIKDGLVKLPVPPPTPPPPVAGPDGVVPEAPPAPKAEEPPPLEGNLKIDCLGRCCTGPLREVNAKDQKEAGKMFARVIQCNFAELQGEDMQKELAKQWKKAQDKGLTELQKKWYWVWYEDKKAAYHDTKWHEPDGYIPMTAISKINRQPERNDQFIISYSEEGGKKVLIYRREGGKSLDVWIDGLELLFNECRTVAKDEKDAEEQLKKNGPPQGV